MTRAALLTALLAALPVAAQELPLPPPPPPPSDDLPSPPPARAPYGEGSTSRGYDRPSDRSRDSYDRYGERRPAAGAAAKPAKAQHVPGTIGEGPVAPAGSQAASLHPDEAAGHWRYSLASGVVGRWGGDLVEPPHPNANTMIYFGAQADGLWSEGYGRGARLRLRMMTGGENVIFIPSDGEVEAALTLGRPEFHFVAGRLEAARSTALGYQAFVQAATFPTIEGSAPLAGDTMRVAYLVAPVEAAWAYYRDANHIPTYAVTPQESGRIYPATAGRLRYSVVLPPAVLLSVQGDFLKLWGVPDLLASAEGSIGISALENSVLFNLSLRWDHSTLRAAAKDSSKSYDQMLGMIVATLLL